MLDVVEDIAPVFHQDICYNRCVNEWGIVCVVHAFVHLVLYVRIHHAGPREKGSSNLLHYINAPDLPDVFNFDTKNMAGVVCRAPLYWRSLDVLSTPSC